ncbi:hypothetical protein JTB14_027671 [Gonioctena quinquepunctata]|nr:hypothetical protein JTB14_027671 [Gonioctena quinquepunctata]
MRSVIDDFSGKIESEPFEFSPEPTKQCKTLGLSWISKTDKLQYALNENDKGYKKKEKNDERVKHCDDNIATEVSDMEKAAEEDTTDVQPSSSGATRRSTREKKPPTRFHKEICKIVINEPSSYQEAISGIEAEHWTRAINEELDSMHENDVWDIVVMPPDRKADHEQIGAIYVDDLLVLGITTEEIDDIDKVLENNFEVTVLGVPKYLLSFQIEWFENYVSISQEHYIENILDEFNMMDSNIASIPLDIGDKPNETGPDDSRINKKINESKIGSLLYLAMGTRRDIAYSVKTLSHFCVDPFPVHHIMVQHLSRYLKGSNNRKPF